MNKTILIVATGILTAGMISCGSNDAAQTKVAENEHNSASVSYNDCIAGHFSAIDRLFTLDLVVSEINLPKDKAKTKYSKPGKNMNYHSLTYSWEGDRKRQMQVGDRTVEVPRLDVVTISGFDTMEPAQFKKVYRTLSAEEKENAKKAIDAELEKQKATETTKNLSDGVGSDLISGQVYEEVAGVGTTALWHPAHGQLLVLSGTSKFVIFVDVYDDVNENRARSVALAKALIKACGE